KKYLSKRDEAKVIVETERLFNSLSIQEKEVLAFAVMANNKIVLKHGDPVALSLMRKGLLHRSGVTYSASGKEKFVIPDVWFHECYMRFAGKADELI
ncbi:superinfection exclusion protein B, partial [Escherichia coli]|nr:superinfection exclusion protein B [Escherichia coli]HDU8850014.1 superinfection exclusion protein B [Escherichia coli]